jgi:hypothetical protein
VSYIFKQMKRDFKKLLAASETPNIIVKYNVRTGGQVKVGYGTITNDTVESCTKTVKAIIAGVDHWSIKRLPYADLQIGQTLFYIDTDLDLTNAEDITVEWGGRTIPVNKPRPVTPIGSSYLAQALVSIGQ